jgi:hypothetical protein
MTPGQEWAYLTIQGFLQGVQGQTFMFHFTLGDRNIQARFGLKVV